MFKFFNKYSYSFIFWFHFALIAIVVRQYYLEEKYYIFTIFPTKINFSFSFMFIIFTLYTLLIFLVILRKSKTSSTNRFLVFMGNLVVTVHLIYTISQTYNLASLTVLKNYYITSQIDDLKTQLPISVNSFTELIDLNIQNKEIIYVYKLNKPKTNLEMIDLKSFKKGVQDSLCNEAYSIDVLKHDYSLKYTYLDNNKEKITDVETTKKDCGESIYDIDYLKLILIDKNI